MQVDCYFVMLNSIPLYEYTYTFLCFPTDICLRNFSLVNIQSQMIRAKHMDIKAIVDNFSRLCVYNNNNYRIKMLGAMQPSLDQSMNVGLHKEDSLSIGKDQWIVAQQRTLLNLCTL